MSQGSVASPIKQGLLRGAIARGLAAAAADASQIDRTGGDYGAGIIRGFAVITRGEALGHEMWCDAVFLGQVADALNALPDGVKSRFTHPDMSSDGLGNYLGRAKNARVDGDVVRADLHFQEVAHKAPDGDLAGYVMDLADADHKAFGASIVFWHDDDAEIEFMRSHYVATAGGSASFVSPDPDNTENYSHCRLSELRAVDVVDSPAANPDGMFRRPSPVDEAEACLSYALGLSSDLPATFSLDVHPDRLRGFLTRFLDRNDLAIAPTRKDLAMTDPVTAPAAPAPTKADFLGEMKRYQETFGDAQGANWFAAGKTFEECLGLKIAALTSELAGKDKATADALAAKDKEITDLKARLDSLKTGERPVSFSATGPDGSTKVTGLSSVVRIPGQAK